MESIFVKEKWIQLRAKINANFNPILSWYLFFHGIKLQVIGRTVWVFTFVPNLIPAMGILMAFTPQVHRYHFHAYNCPETENFQRNLSANDPSAVAFLHLKHFCFGMNITELEYLLNVSNNPKDWVNVCFELCLFYNLERRQKQTIGQLFRNFFHEKMSLYDVNNSLSEHLLNAHNFLFVSFVLFQAMSFIFVVENKKNCFWSLNTVSCIF